MPASNLFSSLVASPQFLRRVLWLDAATGVATGSLQLLLSGFLAALLGLPETLIVVSGWLMFGYAAGIVLITSRSWMPPAAVRLLVIANGLWVLGCLALLFGDIVTPTLSGKAFIAVQAVAVGLLAELQWIGLRRAPAQPAW